MGLLADLDGKDILFTWGLFGVQSDRLSLKKELIAKVHELLNQSAGRVDLLRDENDDPDKHCVSTIFIAHWQHRKDYEVWKTKDLEPFWRSLPDDAGVWREVMTVPKSRYMFFTSSSVASGFASLVGTKPGTDGGYWGVYRDRMAAHPDRYTAPGDTLTSPYASKTIPGRKLVDLEKRYPNEIHRGRLKVTRAPDNICFIREMQALSNLGKQDSEIWLQSLNPYFRSWVDHLDTHHNRNGVLSFSTHAALNPSDLGDQGLAHNRTVKSSDGVGFETNQLMYFLDLGDFELAGRSFKDHVKLRNSAIDLLRPGGKLFKTETLRFTVEMCVVKAEDLDAEYVGCKKGTRLMILEDL
ncbi:hypothetical protein NW762_006130 [Fusarium torreyae]|uniref:Phenylacetaldoxime dehydratase n=1 Tax=Fusarium torreyae TaxID=1237075 RepID=A0A9W8S3D1_9HYPO|nr:hypothetical protein NW762_006130 [Fusarium torreyae]